MDSDNESKVVEVEEEQLDDVAGGAAIHGGSSHHTNPHFHRTTQ